MRSAGFSAGLFGSDDAYFPFSILDKLGRDFYSAHPLTKTFRRMYNRDCLFTRGCPHGIGKICPQHSELCGH